ncbi:hypothetical protein ACLF9T_04115 [Helicobacter pylori]|uniref:hypothetical protein n=2 Tax=Helicobacter pylori TaxID=210 RepID=UPI001EDBC74E|nr:hypothetical protein [Helicobacter pylori]MCG3068996.1 hypothetical protein [Helicobacter pylori]
MKSVNLPTPKGNSKGGFLDNLSSSDMLKLVTASKDLISSAINAQKEISKEQEKTKQVEIQSNQEMIASNNRLREKLAEFQRDITALNKMHEQEMLRLSNEHEKDMKLLEIMQGIINKIDSLNQFLICKHGEHQKVDELHAQLIHYQQALLALISKVN